MPEQFPSNPNGEPHLRQLMPEEELLVAHFRDIIDSRFGEAPEVTYEGQKVTAPSETDTSELEQTLTAEAKEIAAGPDLRISDIPDSSTDEPQASKSHLQQKTERLLLMNSGRHVRPATTLREKTRKGVLNLFRRAGNVFKTRD